MDAGGDRAIYPTNMAVVIKDIYDSEYPHQKFAMELEKALDEKRMVIIIEPTQLGDETARWISFGNCLHKTSVISGAGSIVASIFLPENHLIWMPLGSFSLICTGLYTASWQFDNCVKYQVQKNPRQLAQILAMQDMSPSAPVVLVRKDDTKRKILHWTVTLSAAALCAFRLYKNTK